MPRQLTHHQSAADLQQARRCLMDAGDVPLGLVDDTLRQSWLRSRHAGLSPVDVATEPPLCSTTDLRHTLASEHDLLAHARPVMSFVFDQMRDSGNVVVLADSQGLLLDSLGDTDFATRAERVSLRPGALWHEHDRGTNAIGTALAEQRAVVIHGAEHYLARNSFLTCAAAPVLTSEGRLRGVIDISGDHRGHHPHTFALVRSAARMIEDRLFHARHGHDQVLRLHAHAEGLGAVGEGLVALSEDGWVVGSNQLAREWLNLPTVGGGTLADLTGLRVAQMPPGRTLRLQTSRGLPLFARLDWPRRSVIQTASSPTPSPLARTRDARPIPHVGAPSLAHFGATSPLALDPRLAEAHSRAQRVQAQGIPVLIQGESGTGKEVFARALHTEGRRAARPFVALNCAALPETLIEAELFGYVGGAFTGARREGAPGRIREAEGGTLFLDEIGDMPLALQARLLRVLQDKMVVPLGGNKAHPVDFVLVCATHRNLREAVRTGQFREDLYYRLNGLTLTLPALRERQDFNTLVSHMLDQICRDMARAYVPTVHPGLHQAMAEHRWPGNLRQLHSLLRTACALLEPGEVAIDWRHLPEDMVQELQDGQRTPAPSDAAHHDDRSSLASPPLAALAPASLSDANLRRLSHQAIQQVIAATQGNMSEAARRLGISRNTLYRRLKQAPD